MSLTHETYNRVRHHYDEHGLPLAWREIEHPQVKAAVRSFMNQEAVTEEHLSLLADICSYHVDSPTWSAPDPDTGLFPNKAHLDLLSDLRHDAKTISTVDALENWLVAAYILAGLEPLGELPVWLRQKKRVQL